ncbi:MAG TPA: helix-turn-helix domain-containing protein [Chitinophagales bacterium]|nr:helix-turn-helix domain-containing protein [Chitinophagales bacterium]
MSSEIKLIVITEENLVNLIREVLHSEIERLEQKLLTTNTQKLFGDRLWKKDVAQLLGVSIRTVTCYAKKGTLPKAKLHFNGKPYWEKEEVVAAIKANDLNWKYNL